MPPLPTAKINYFTEAYQVLNCKYTICLLERALEFPSGFPEPRHIYNNAGDAPDRVGGSDCRKSSHVDTSGDRW
jgi:hypothetical protein